MKPVSEPLKAQWDRSFADLQARATRVGRLPSRRSKEADECRLANWLNRQRTDARKQTIDPERERLLRTTPGALEARGLRLSDIVLAERVSSFHVEHGKLPRHRVEGENRAAIYLSRLRAMTLAGSISAEALEVFSAIPGAVLKAPVRQVFTVNERLRQVDDYLSKHGHIPPAKGDSLYRWMWRARRGKASANAAEAERARIAVEKLIMGYPAALRSKPAR